MAGDIDMMLDAIEPQLNQLYKLCDSTSEAAQISIAISLKRIADGLERQGQPLILEEKCATLEETVRDKELELSHASDIGEAIASKILLALKAPLNEYGESLGECIEGQLNRSAQR